jgi:hypothetical protein
LAAQPSRATSGGQISDQNLAHIWQRQEVRILRNLQIDRHPGEKTAHRRKPIGQIPSRRWSVGRPALTGPYCKTGRILRG